MQGPPSTAHPRGGAPRGIPRFLGALAKQQVATTQDPLEREADHVADSITSASAPISRATTSRDLGNPRPAPNTGAIQLQPNEAGGRSNAASSHAPSTTSLPELGPGRTLPDGAQRFLAPHFGRLAAEVVVHDGPAAHQAAASLGARAFATNGALVFARGELAPGTSSGRWLLAHEMTHVAQQRAGRADGRHLYRSPTEGGIEDDRYSYSTNCGWIDWGHTNPAHARDLIGRVREASLRMARREETQAATLAVEGRPLVSEAECSATYEANEVADSGGESPVVSSRELGASGAIEIAFGGFGVDSSASEKFASDADVAAATIQGLGILRGVGYRWEIRGFSDCIGARERNADLRRQRGTEIAVRLAMGLGRGMVAGGDPMLDAVFVDAPLDGYLQSNSTRAGRRVNRGVLVRVIPKLSAESFSTPRMESRAPVVGLMSGVTLTSGLQRSLTEDEILRVAWGLFIIQSSEFETLQGWTDFLAGSSFSEEDLPSNRIGFYRAARGYSSAEIRDICDVWSKEDSLVHIETYSFRKNRHWEPPSLPPGGAWPAELATIHPALPGSELYDIASVLRETALSSATQRNPRYRFR